MLLNPTMICNKKEITNMTVVTSQKGMPVHQLQAMLVSRVIYRFHYLVVQARREGLTAGSSLITASALFPKATRKDLSRMSNYSHQPEKLLVEDLRLWERHPIKGLLLLL
jgi:hypothetical protein